MDDFTKYVDMRQKSASPREIYLAGKADGLDAITLIRLLRTVCGLSLAQAKETSYGGQDPFAAKPEIGEGGKVYWVGWNADEGNYLMEARISRIQGNQVFLENQKKYRLANGKIEEIPISGPPVTFKDLSFFEKPLAERLGDALQFLPDILRAETKVS